MYVVKIKNQFNVSHAMYYSYTLLIVIHYLSSRKDSCALPYHKETSTTYWCHKEIKKYSSKNKRLRKKRIHHPYFTHNTNKVQS